MRHTILTVASLVAASLSAASAADLPNKKKTPEPPVVSSPWTGFYVGLNGGYTFQNTATTTDLTTTNPKTSFRGGNGFIIGAQLGYDHQIQSVVLGIAADIDYDATKKSHHPSWSASPLYQLKVSNEWTGTVRGRLGYLVSQDLLLYATSGLAVGRKHLKDNENGVPPSQSKTHLGLVVGGGLEYRVTKNISTFVEYRYYAYEALNYVKKEVKSKSDNSEIRVGLNYRF
jgi:outer membrane immunogenic protein